MDIDEQDYLRLVESAKTIAFIDIETRGFKGDYNSVLVVSIKPFASKPFSKAVDEPDDDEELVAWASNQLNGLDCWVTYYGKGFDMKMINTRLLRYDHLPLEKRHHIDLYYSLKANLLTARKSLGHLASWLRLPEEKMSVSADDWARAGKDWNKKDDKGITLKQRMIKRCESDTRLTENLYTRTKHLFKSITR